MISRISSCLIGLICLTSLVSLAIALDCPAPLRPGDHELGLVHDGLDRFYMLHVPAWYNASAPVALVVSWHSKGMSPVPWAQASGFSESSETRGNFVVAYPRGLDYSFNAGSCCFPSSTRNIDDFGFARAIVAHASALVCVDPRKVFTTGFSNGCFMSQGLICHSPDLFAASACGSGGIVVDGSCGDHFSKFPNASISVLEIHGTADIIVPYPGNFLLGFPPVPKNFAANVEMLECKSGPRQVFQAGRYSCEEYFDCRDGAVVQQCTVDLGIHTWFDSRDFYATDYILDFFGL